MSELILIPLGIFMFFALLHSMSEFLQRSFTETNGDNSAEWLSVAVCVILFVIGVVYHEGIYAIIGAVITLCVLSSKNKEKKKRKKWNNNRPNRETRQYQFEQMRQNEEDERKRAENLRAVEDEHKKRIELMAMNRVISHEKSNGRNPVDVSIQNLGYDLKSSGGNETLFIEVKGRSDDTGYILMTSNEWSKAQEWENNYHLYVVVNCDQNLSCQRLYIVVNPANRLNANYIKEQNKYQIELGEIKQKA